LDTGRSADLPWMKLLIRDTVIASEAKQSRAVERTSDGDCFVAGDSLQ
jgi:hypothetical protein